MQSKQIKVIPNAIDINKFKKLKTRKYTNRAITISRLENKNIFSLQIFVLSNLNLDIIGTGTQLNEIKIC